MSNDCAGSVTVPTRTIPNVYRMRTDLGLSAVEVVSRLRARGIKVAPSDLSRLEKALTSPTGLAMQTSQVLAEEAQVQGVAW